LSGEKNGGARAYATWQQKHRVKQHEEEKSRQLFETRVGEEVGGITEPSFFSSPSLHDEPHSSKLMGNGGLEGRHRFVDGSPGGGSWDAEAAAPRVRVVGEWAINRTGRRAGDGGGQHGHVIAGKRALTVVRGSGSRVIMSRADR